MRIAVRIAGLAAAAALVLWCAVVAIHSFTRQAGAGLPRLDGGAGLQVLLGAAALVGAGLVVAAAFALDPARLPPRAALLARRVPARVGGAGGGGRVARRPALPRAGQPHVRRRPRRDVHGGAGLGDLLLDGRRGLRRARRRPARPLGARRPRGRARQPPGRLTAGAGPSPAQPRPSRRPADRLCAISTSTTKRTSKHAMGLLDVRLVVLVRNAHTCPRHARGSAGDGEPH